MTDGIDNMEHGDGKYEIWDGMPDACVFIWIFLKIIDSQSNAVRHFELWTYKQILLHPSAINPNPQFLQGAKYFKPLYHIGNGLETGVAMQLRDSDVEVSWIIC